MQECFTRGQSLSLFLCDGDWNKGNFIYLTQVASHQLVHIKGWRHYNFFCVFKTILIVSLRRDEMLTWLIFHLFGNLSDNN